MKALGRLVRLVVVVFVGVMAVSAAQAFQRKRDAPLPPDPDEDEIELVTIFDQVDFRSTAQAFRGGRVEARFGGGTIDLRGARLDPAGAVLRTQAIFGGGTILVPEDWSVTTSVVGIGGAGDARGVTPTDDGPHLTIEGTAVFGGWGIMSEDPRN
jgi:hypothetical protein